jgi:hypothetical protein
VRPLNKQVSGVIQVHHYGYRVLIKFLRHLNLLSSHVKEVNYFRQKGRHKKYSLTTQEIHGLLVLHVTGVVTGLRGNSVQPLLPTKQDPIKATCRSRSTKTRRVLVMEKTPHNSDSFKPTQSEESAQTDGAGVCGMNFSDQQAESAEKLHSDGNGQGAAPASGSNGFGTDGSFHEGAERYVMLDPFEIEIDPSIWTRIEEDFVTVNIYFEALSLQEVFAPIVVEEIDGQWKVLDGVHRLYAHRRMKESSSQADYKIPCKVATNPSKMSRLIYSYSLNRMNGKALKIQDYEKVVQALYKENLGAPVETLAKKLKINPKTFRKYAAPLIKEFERECDKWVQELLKIGFSQKSIEQQILQKYPHITGYKRSNISNKKLGKSKKSSADKDGKGSDADQVNTRSKRSSFKWNSLGIDPAQHEVNTDELHLIFGKESPVLMIRKVDFLRSEQGSKYIRAIVNLTRVMNQKELRLRSTEQPQNGESRISDKVRKGDRGPPTDRKLQPGFSHTWLAPRFLRRTTVSLGTENKHTPKGEGGLHETNQQNRSSLEMVWR